MSSTNPSAPGPGINLLRWRPIAALVRSVLFPDAVQILFLAVFVGMAVFSWQLFPPEGVPDKLYAKSNLVNLVIWGLWWPAMVWIMVGFGRVWCAVCPLEWLAKISERLGRALRVPQRPIARWLQSGVLMLLFYGLLQMLVPGLHLHRVPAYTSIFLWSLLFGAVIVGFLMRDRAFCRGFCPVGLMLGTYGRGSMLAVRAVTPAGEATAKPTESSPPQMHHASDARRCPSLLNPARLDANADCLLCGRCLKPGNPQPELGLFLRRPFHSADVRPALASWPVTLFVVMVSGFVASELCSEWAAAKDVFAWVPEQIATALGTKSLAGWIEGVWTIIVVPLTVWLILGAAVRVAGGASSLGEAWRRLALPAAVIIAAGQMAKGLAKFMSWAGYLPLALRDPQGTDTALAIQAKSLSQPAGLISLPTVSVLSMILVAAMIVFALRESRLADAATLRSRVAPLLLLGAATLGLILGWGLQ